MKLNERKKVAIALGYYARAVGEIKTLSDAIAAYALDEYRNDVDCQVGFRKGYQQAEEHFAAGGKEACELRKLVEWIQKLEHEVVRQRQDIREYLRRQEMLANAVHNPFIAKDDAGDQYFVGGGYGAGEPKLIVKVSGGASGGAKVSGGSLGDKSIPYKVYGDEPVLDHDGPFQMRRCDTGELYCQDGNPVVYIGYKACAEACRYLHDNIGISCLPSPGRMHAWAAPKEPSVASMSGRRLTGPNKGACLARLPARLHKERTNG